MNPVKTEDIVLDIQDLRKSFGKRQVLSGVSLQARRGEIIGIVGENGVGKSTLLKSIVGLLRPDSGNIKIKGSFGYCPQDMLLFESLTVDENFRLFASAYGLNGGRDGDDWKQAKSGLMKMLTFEEYGNMMVSRLSGGTRQKLNFSLSVLHHPDLLVLDEPYSALDWESYKSFWDYTERMKETRRTVILVSHMIFEREKLDRLFELKNGILRCAPAN